MEGKVASGTSNGLTQAVLVILGPADGRAVLRKLPKALQFCAPSPEIPARERLRIQKALRLLATRAHDDDVAGWLAAKFPDGAAWNRWRDGTQLLAAATKPIPGRRRETRRDAAG